LSIYAENFETIFEVKNNIQALRNKVLELAIQGKLIEQDPNDEPASELVKKIQAERDKLVKEGIIKKQPPLPKIEEDEIPFKVPESWEWVRLGVITSYGDNITLSPENIKDEEWVLELEDIEKNSSKVLNVSYNKERQSKSNKNRFYKGDVLYGKLRPYLKKVLVAPKVGVCTTEIIAFRGYCDISASYIVYYLKSQYVDKYVNSITYGMKMPRLGTDNAKTLVFPLPTVGEQHRIVAKIESLMSEIDKLEESLQKKEHLLERLPIAVVNAIGSCQTGEELKEQLQFVIENFETVFQTPESMQELRNVMFQLAIEGELVPQGPNDEPASELVKKIQTEKDRLVKEGKIKKQQPLEPIEVGEIPFEIPESWAWVRLDAISLLITKGSSPKWQGVSYTDKEEVLFITSENVGNNKLRMDKKKYVESKFNEIEPRSILAQNDILMNIVGASIGRTAIYDLDEVANINQAVCLIRVLYDPY